MKKLKYQNKELFIKTCEYKLSIYQKNIISNDYFPDINSEIMETYRTIEFTLIQLKNLSDTRKINNFIIYLENLFFFLENISSKDFMLKKA